MVQVEPAGAVEGFLGAACGQAVGQEVVLVAVAAGEVDGEAPGVLEAVEVVLDELSRRRLEKSAVSVSVSSCRLRPRQVDSRARRASEVGQEPFDDVFFFDAECVGRDVVAQLWVPRCVAGFGWLEGCAESSGHRFEVGRVVVAPGGGGGSGAFGEGEDAGGDAGASPVEVAVVAEGGAAGHEPAEDAVRGYRRAAFQADQGWAGGAQFGGCR